MIAWVHIFTALESALTPTACYAASVNPWTETTWDNVLHYCERYWEARTKMMGN